MKTKTKKITLKSKSNRAKKYSEHYLALALMSVLLLEGALIGATTKTDWQSAAEIFDLSTNVSRTVSDLSAMFEPVVTAVEGVNEFYSQATTAAIPLLDLSQSDNDVMLVVSAINEFYARASIEMAIILDLSASASQIGNVAGLSIEVNQ